MFAVIAVLALDTCLSALTLAVTTGSGDVVSISEEIGIGHAEKIAPAFSELMARASLAPSAITRIGVTVGPGSFMGQRVGIAFAKGLAMGLGAETVALTTLEAIAAGTGSAPVAVAIDARREQAYAQSFAAGGRPEAPAELKSYAEARRWLAAFPRAAGSGVSAADPARNPVGPGLPRAETLIRLTEERQPSPLSTFYLRAPDAKRPKGLRP